MTTLTKTQELNAETLETLTAQRDRLGELYPDTRIQKPNRVDIRRAQPYHNGIKTRPFTIRIQEDIYQTLAALADKSGETISQTAIRLITRDMRKR